MDSIQVSGLVEKEKESCASMVDPFLVENGGGTNVEEERGGIRSRDVRCTMVNRM